MLRRAAKGRTRQLPEWFLPIAHPIVADADLPRVADGSDTRQLMGAIGAPAATVDSTVFVAEPVHEPSPQAAEILSHELVHASKRPAAPRFFMGPLDLEERIAREVGEQTRSMSSAASEGAGALTSKAGGALSAAASDLGEVGSGAITSARGTAEEQLAAARATASDYALRGGAALGGGLAQSRAALTGAAAPLLSRIRSAGIPNAAGLLGGLAGGFTESAGAELAAATRVEAGLSALPQTVQAGLGSAQGLATDVARRAAASGGEAAGGLMGAAEQVGADLTSAAGRATGTIGSLLGGASSAATDATSQMSELLELIEDRVMAELERRGGRFEGVF